MRTIKFKESQRAKKYQKQKDRAARETAAATNPEKEIFDYPALDKRNGHMNQHRRHGGFETTDDAEWPTLHYQERSQGIRLDSSEPQLAFNSLFSGQHLSPEERKIQELCGRLRCAEEELAEESRGLEAAKLKHGLSESEDLYRVSDREEVKRHKKSPHIPDDAPSSRPLKRPIIIDSDSDSEDDPIRKE